MELKAEDCYHCFFVKPSFSYSDEQKILFTPVFTMTSEDKTNYAIYPIIYLFVYLVYCTDTLLTEKINAPLQ